MKETLNELGRKKIPFFFLINFEATNAHIAPLTTLQESILFSIDGITNITDIPKNIPIPSLTLKKPIHYTQYRRAFNTVQQEMRRGNTYLLNLTFPTEIAINTTLKNIFWCSQATFKLYYQDKFIVFSPERFIKIDNAIIKTYPMKGTIDAAIPDARQRILADEKEQAEHTMVVDLLRNDLAMVAKKVKLQRYRYIDQIKAGTRELLQVSSEITGELDKNWQDHIGELLLTLLPAGSISGTPKKKTVEIIKSVEKYDRGFFSGIFGYFDGENLDSAVAIRFIERQTDKFFYKSGGGITVDSDVTAEYQELLQKIYIPV